MERSYKPLLFELLAHFPCVAIIGPRQCGKTTLLGTLPVPWRIHDLENLSDYQVISRDPDLFFRLNPERIAIDEAQRFPELFAALRVAIDRDRGCRGRFVITGSSSPELLRSVGESLAGRVAIIEMAPFSFAEIRHKIPPMFLTLLANRAPAGVYPLQIEPCHQLPLQHDFWFRGGYPEPWIKNNSRFHALWMNNYIGTYLFRDVARLFPGLNANRFRSFMQILAGVSGQVINYAEVARALGVSQPTARDYFQIAHGTFLWRQVPPYTRDAVKRIVKHPKGHLRDTGLLHYLLRIPDLDVLLAHPIMGRSFEALVIEEIIRGLNAMGIGFDYYYYRTGGGAEIDLILEGEFGLVPVEIKYAKGVGKRQLRSLSDFVRERSCRIGIVINNEERVRLYDENIVGVPFACI
ncbi:MAG: ATP-binding protein [Desulfobacterales bacterium]|nr:ATP-binding protein [Desulfobacterales bacterium]